MVAGRDAGREDHEDDVEGHAAHTQPIHGLVADQATAVLARQQQHARLVQTRHLNTVTGNK